MRLLALVVLALTLAACKQRATEAALQTHIENPRQFIGERLSTLDTLLAAPELQGVSPAATDSDEEYRAASYQDAYGATANQAFPRPSQSRRTPPLGFPGLAMVEEALALIGNERDEAQEALMTSALERVQRIAGAPRRQGKNEHLSLTQTRHACHVYYQDTDFSIKVGEGSITKYSVNSGAGWSDVQGKLVKPHQSEVWFITKRSKASFVRISWRKDCGIDLEDTDGASLESLGQLEDTDNHYHIYAYVDTTGHYGSPMTIRDPANFKVTTLKGVGGGPLVTFSFHLENVWVGDNALAIQRDCAEKILAYVGEGECYAGSVNFRCQIPEGFTDKELKQIQCAKPWNSIFGPLSPGSADRRNETLVARRERDQTASSGQTSEPVESLPGPGSQTSESLRQTYDAKRRMIDDVINNL